MCHNGYTSVLNLELAKKSTGVIAVDPTVCPLVLLVLLLSDYGCEANHALVACNCTGYREPAIKVCMLRADFLLG